MIRRLFTVSSALSLLVCTTAIVLLLRNRSSVEFFAVGHKVWKGASIYESKVASAEVRNGRIYFGCTRLRLDFSQPQQVVFRQPMDVKTFREKNPSGTTFMHRRYPPGGLRGPAADWHGFRWYSISDSSVAEGFELREFSVPAWFFIVVTGLPAIWLVAVGRHLRRSRRIAAGLCIQCGYDLRASQELCPECGTSIRLNPA